MSPEHNLAAVAREFQIGGAFVSAERYGSGHINDTYRVVFERPACRRAMFFSASITMSSRIPRR